MAYRKLMSGKLVAGKVCDDQDNKVAMRLMVL